MPIGFLWQTFLETPLINLLLALTTLSFGSYGLAILLFTFITRAVTFPLTVRTLHATRRMQDLAPQTEEIKKKYSDPKRRSEEQMKLYREAGVNPIGCLGPQLIQMPVFIALYQVIRITVGGTPEAAVDLEHRMYSIDFIRSAIPLSTDFLFLDLAQNGNFVLVAIVFAGMWLQQRISSSRTSSSSGSQQAQMNQMMQWMMPVMFAWFVLVVPAGLGLYWAATTIIGIALQWIFVGPGDFTWGSLVPVPIRARLGLPSIVPPTAAPQPATSPAEGDTSPAAGDSETRSDDGTGSGSQRNRRRGRNRTRSQSARSQPQSGRRRRRPRR